MEEFLKLNWRIGPDAECYESEFLPDEEISRSYIYNGIPSADVDSNETEPMVNGRNILRTKQKSFLTRIEHVKCLNALALIQSGKQGKNPYDTSCLELFNNVRERIIKENNKFLQFAKYRFNTSNQQLKLTRRIQNYFYLVLNKQLEICQSYPQYYKKINSMSYCYGEEDVPVEMIHLGNILEVGSLAKLTRPTLSVPYYVNPNSLPDTYDSHSLNKPVSEDLNIKELLKSHNVDIVISSSSLKKLINFTAKESLWEIPVVIKQIEGFNQDGTASHKKIVFVDKPFPSMKPSKEELIKRAFKLSLKRNLCNSEALQFSNTEENNEAVDESLINEEVKVHRNVSYRLWHLRQEKQCPLMKSCKTKDVKVLVRCKLDGCEEVENSVLQPLTLIPKLENQPDFGGTISSKTELVNQWTYLFFRPFSKICRARIATPSKEILMLEDCNIFHINNDLHAHYNYKTSLGLGVLSKIFSELMALTFGSYVLRHSTEDGSFITLWQSCSDETSAYNLYDSYNIDKWCISDTRQQWHPIDCNLVLPTHLAQKRMPGLFPPGKKGFKPNHIMMRKQQKYKKKKKNAKKPNKNRSKMKPHPY